MPYGKARSTARGFTYVGMLFLIVLIGLALAGAGEVARTTAQRERETELLFIGHQYRDAIARFYQQNRHYPESLQQLVAFQSTGPAAVHYLRRLYRDPMTRSNDWTLVDAPDQGIMGVASSSLRKPLKSAGFDDVDADFETAKSYADWAFTYDPRSATLRALQRAGSISVP